MAAVPLLFVLLLLLLAISSSAITPDVQNLLLLKSSFSNSSHLSSWTESSSPCDPSTPWLGVTCEGGAVSGLRLESLSLSNHIDVDALSLLKSLRTLSFSNNSFSGPIPPLNKLDGLKTLFLSNNNFSGVIPDGFFAEMDHLKKLHLSNNQFSGAIPSSLSRTKMLMVLQLKNNKFSGEIPSLELPALAVLDLADNLLTGQIPVALARFKEDSFINNPGLCGPPLTSKPCPSPPSGGGKNVALLVLVLAVALVALLILQRRRERVFDTLGIENGTMGSGKARKDAKVEPPVEKGANAGSERGQKRANGKEKAGPGGDLVMVNEERGAFGIADLMKAAAEVMGNGGLGSAYKAVMGNGTAVVVKRMRDMNRLGKESFDVEMRRLGRLRHENVLTPLAYHYRKEEKLLISEFVPKGSLLYILHGDRGTDHSALDWPTRLKIVLGIARGMSHLHTELNHLDIPHGNLKSGNVLLTPTFQPLLVDYGFLPFLNPSVASQTLTAYKSPETSSQRRICPKSDVYCFGIIILELLTGKFPSQYLNNTKGGTDVIQWASTAISENHVAELIDPAIIITAKAAIPEMERLIIVGVACVEPNPDDRIDMKEACRRIEEVAAVANKAIGAKVKDGYQGLIGSVIEERGSRRIHEDEDRC